MERKQIHDPYSKNGIQPPIHVKINERWGVCCLDRKQWYLKSQMIWGNHKAPKKSCLLWLILHQGIWNAKRATKMGIGNGLCPRCMSKMESIQHLLFQCRDNKEYLTLLKSSLLKWNNITLTWKHFLLADVPLAYGTL